MRMIPRHKSFRPAAASSSKSAALLLSSLLLLRPTPPPASLAFSAAHSRPPRRNDASFPRVLGRLDADGNNNNSASYGATFAKVGVRGSGGSAAKVLAAVGSAENAEAEASAEEASSASSATATATATAGGQQSVHLRLGSRAMLESMRKGDAAAAADDDDEAGEDASDDPSAAADEDDARAAEREKRRRDSRRRKYATLRTYEDRPRGIHLCGLDVSESKFAAWVKHEVLELEPELGNIELDERKMSREEIRIDDPAVREGLREIWRKRQLLADRTEALASYRSDEDKAAAADSADGSSADGSGVEGAKGRRRGDFPDLLSVYADRLVGILRDETEERNNLTARAAAARQWLEETVARNATEAAAREKELIAAGGSSGGAAEGGGILGWLEREYGAERVETLKARTLLTLTEEEQMHEIKNFLEWFRDRFPYYYDRCDHCGASERDGTAGAGPEPSEEEEDDDEEDGEDDEISGSNSEADADDDDEDSDDDEEDDEDEDEDDASSFLGYVYPSESELLGRASRTELYRCRRCHKFTRFPRYNAASSVVTYRRGRCGEYSMLLFRFLRALGHEARWVVDWSDHVWAEVRLGGGGGGGGEKLGGGRRRSRKERQRRRWVHLDPCEAAVDEPLLYQGWGKRQTFIVAFRAPPPPPPPAAAAPPLREETGGAGGFSSGDATAAAAAAFASGGGLITERRRVEEEVGGAEEEEEGGPLIEDVTRMYTSDAEEDIAGRREEPEELVLSSLSKTENELRERLGELRLEVA